MRAAATQYCSACMARLTGLRYQERAKRAHKMLVWRRLDAPLAPLSQRSHLPDLSDVLSQSTAHNTCKLEDLGQPIDLFAGKGWAELAPVCTCPTCFKAQFSSSGRCLRPVQASLSVQMLDQTDATLWVP